MESASETTSDSLKELGNKAVQAKKYTEAILHYTHGIKLDPANYALYSNRSYAFLKEQQYFLALEDANETIRLCPGWAKGYFRKGEVEFAAHHLAEACQSYKKALDLQPGDVNILEAFNRASRQLLENHKADETTPWLWAGIGLIIGIFIMISEYIFTENPTHPILMAVIAILISLIGYGLAKTYRYFINCSKEGLLERPPDLGLDDEKHDEETETKTHSKYTKSQARQRYKKGKL